MSSETTDIKVAICIPCTDYLPVDFVHSLLALQAFTTDWNKGAKEKGWNELDVNAFIFRSSLIVGSRTELVKDALQWGAEWILWLDSDMAFPPDTLARLLERKHHMVGSNYVKRGIPTMPVTTGLQKEFVRTDPETTGLQEVSTTGFGVMLMSADIFRKLELPWFDTVWLEDNKLMGEDVFFFKKAKAFLGLSPWIDHDLSQLVRHIGTFEYFNRLAKATMEEFEAQTREENVCNSAAK
jgi:hypothetical protein